MTAYVIYQGEVLDPVRYEEYKIKAAESILRAGGRYLVRGGDAEVLEGDAPAARTVVLKFQSMQDAIAWYAAMSTARYESSARVRRGLGCTPLKGSPDEPVLSAARGCRLGQDGWVVECRCEEIDRLDGDEASLHAREHPALVERGRDSARAEDFLCGTTGRTWVMDFPLRHWAPDRRGAPRLRRWPFDLAALLIDALDP